MTDHNWTRWMSQAEREATLPFLRARPATGTSGRMSRDEARSRARERFRRAHGLSVAEHALMLARSAPSEIVRRDSMTANPYRGGNSKRDASEATGTGRDLTGYATTFNDPYEVDSYYEGTFTERIAPGAFAASLRNAQPIMMFNHGGDSRVGSVPIGTATASEDSKGLRIRGELFDNEAVRPVQQAIRAQAIRGMSIMMKVDEDTWTRGAAGKPDTRLITRATVYEAGPVVWPANRNTTVNVRSAKRTGLTPGQRRAKLTRL